MDRLSQSHQAPPNANPTTFTRCWICGHESNDICEFRMWQECDEQDEPEDFFIILCRDKGCRHILNDHPRLYIEVPWAGDTPGRLMLACSDCEQRRGFRCMDHRAKINGGEGLSCKATNPLNGIVYTRRGCHPIPPVFTSCEGYKKRVAP